MKQTAIEWLLEEWPILEAKIPPRIIDQAKAMEKEQIMDAYANGSNDRLKNTITDYYNETYK
jgi:hypothetical protein